MDKDLEHFEALTTAESQLIAADNHHFENNELFWLTNKNIFLVKGKKKKIQPALENNPHSIIIQKLGQNSNFSKPE